MAIDSLQVLSPIGDDAAPPAQAARRIGTLNGKTVALLSNDMFRADKVLACVADQVLARFPDAKIIPWSELPAVSAMGDVETSVARVTAALRERRPDAVVASTGA